MKLHVNWGHASAQQLNRVSAGPDGNNLHLLTCVGEVSEQREGCRAFDKAPHAPIAGASAAAMSNEELLADLLVLDAAIAVRAMGVFSKFV